MLQYFTDTAVYLPLLYLLVCLFVSVPSCVFVIVSVPCVFVLALQLALLMLSLHVYEHLLN